MANVSGLRKVHRLGVPPPLSEASSNLSAPEVAPAATRRRDGRSLRRTNRVVPFATRVSPEFDTEIRGIAERDGIKLVEVLERALGAYKREHHG